MSRVERSRLMNAARRLEQVDRHAFLRILALTESFVAAHDGVGDEEEFEARLAFAGSHQTEAN